MTRSHKISAIILAAGFSRRMGTFKPLMRLGGQAVLDRVIALYADAGVKDIRVVTGHRASAIRSALASRPVSVVHNPDYETGMFSSVRAGVHALPPDARAFFVHPADIPLVRPHTATTLMDAFDDNPAAVTYPVFDDLRGHPPLVHGELKDDILSHDGSGGLRVLLRRFVSKARNIQVADEGVMLDLDTPDDFQHVSTRLARSDILTDDECRVLMEKVIVLPRPVIDHCRQVACVAETVASAVNGSGGVIDVPLVQSAARVHDVARLERNHAAAGAGLLNEMGLPAMAAIVAVHMDINVFEDSPLDEAQVVYLADKLVAGSTVVSLSQRFDAKLKKYGHDPKISEKISQRRRAAFNIQNKVERTSGDTIHQILKKAGIINWSQPCETS
ncbi:MAG: NTP transferase domain-containing protein [Desulfosarcina sp.]|nr:NTP transferase domain-containing protein [Desulfosarcina sp.]MBC2744197.1 NTP transferase domain-containing protein [Desulfosarcina sp.]MBC2767106.1 NTP transferase domain-containing protein [Desulfosarcina sp.]